VFPVCTFADVADDFIRLGEKVQTATQNPFYEESGPETVLHGEEIRLSEELCRFPHLLSKVFVAAPAIPPALLEVLLNRLRFCVHQEQQSELLQFIPEAYVDRIQSGTSTPFSGAKTQPDLTRGTWHQTPDGRRFWVSETNPEIILSPAEYQHFLTTNPD
jgi:hypothetical protein